MSRWELKEEDGDLPEGWWAELRAALDGRGVTVVEEKPSGVRLAWPGAEEGEQVWADWGSDANQIFLVRGAGGGVDRAEPCDRADPEDVAAIIAQWVGSA